MGAKLLLRSRGQRRVERMLSRRMLPSIVLLRGHRATGRWWMGRSRACWWRGLGVGGWWCSRVGRTDGWLGALRWNYEQKRTGIEDICYDNNKIIENIVLLYKVYSIVYGV